MRGKGVQSGGMNMAEGSGQYRGVRGLRIDTVQQCAGVCTRADAFSMCGEPLSAHWLWAYLLIGETAALHECNCARHCVIRCAQSLTYCRRTKKLGCPYVYASLYL